MLSILDVGAPYELGSYGSGTDPSGGMAITPLMDANNYSLTRSHTRAGAFEVTRVTVTPVTSQGPVAVTLEINGGRPLAAGRYTFTVRSAGPGNRNGVQDFYGNGLDGEFYGYVPSGNRVAGGDFVAGLVAGARVYGLRTLIGTASPLDSPGILVVDHRIPLPRPTKPHPTVSRSKPKAQLAPARRPATRLTTKLSTTHPAGPARLRSRR